MWNGEREWRGEIVSGSKGLELQAASAAFPGEDVVGALAYAAGYYSEALAYAAGYYSEALAYAAGYYSEALAYAAGYYSEALAYAAGYYLECVELWKGKVIRTR